MLEGHDRRALVCVARAADRPALIESAIDQTLREKLVPFAPLLDPPPREQLEPGAGGIDRGDRWRPVLEAPSARAVVEVLHIERERLLHAPPADRAWPRALGDARAGVEER